MDYSTSPQEHSKNNRFAKCLLCLFIGFLVAVGTSISASGFYHLLAGDVPDAMLMISTILGSFFGGVACITVSPIENRKVMVLYYTLFEAFIHIGGRAWDMLRGYHEEKFFASWWLEYLFAFVLVLMAYAGGVIALRILLKRQKKKNV